MLEELRQNINGLIAGNEAEKQRADGLESRLELCKTLVEDYKTQIIELNGQIDNLKLTMAFGGGGDSKVSRERIDKLVREIDKCIKLLEKED